MPRLLAWTALAVVVLGALAAPAAAQEVGSQPALLVVEVTADPVSLTLDAGTPGRITYEILVRNAGDGVIPGVDVTDRLPAGVTVGGQREVRFAVGDLAAANVVRHVLVGDVDPRGLGGETRLVNRVEARSADGQVATAEAATEVAVISARTEERPLPQPVAAPAAPVVTTPAPAPPPPTTPASTLTTEVAAATGPAPRGGGRSAVPVTIAATLVMSAGAILTVAARRRARRHLA
jgi:uncharacterized repeat protein (TIGR01451 family)